MQSNHLILCRPLLLPPSIFPSIRVFSNESVCRIRWPKYWSFSFSPSNECSGLISFRMDCLDLLAVQRILKSLLQHHSSKASIFRRSAFFIVHLSHPYTLWQAVIISLFSVKKTHRQPTLDNISAHSALGGQACLSTPLQPSVSGGPWPPSPASDDTIPTHPQRPSSPNPALLLSAPAGISPLRSQHCAAAAPRRLTACSPLGMPVGLMAGGSGRRGGSVRASDFLGGVSEFHHCCFSCCVMLAKLPDISELWLPHPIKGGSPPATCLIAFRSRKGTNA